MTTSSRPSDKPPGEKAGSCHCGAITIRIEGVPLCSHLCHCTTCQQLSGAPFAMYVDFKAEQVHLDDPTGAIRLYHQQPQPPPPPSDNNNNNSSSSSSSSSNENDKTQQMLGRASCAICAATVQCRNPNLPMLTAVPAGVLASEDAEDATATSPSAATIRYRTRVPPPVVELWCRRRQGWLGPTGARLTYREQPRDEAEMRECMEAFGLV